MGSRETNATCIFCCIFRRFKIFNVWIGRRKYQNVEECSMEKRRKFEFSTEGIPRITQINSNKSLNIIQKLNVSPGIVMYQRIYTRELDDRKKCWIHKRERKITDGSIRNQDLFQWWQKQMQSYHKNMNNNWILIGQNKIEWIS